MALLFLQPYRELKRWFKCDRRQKWRNIDDTQPIRTQFNSEDVRVTVGTKKNAALGSGEEENRRTSGSQHSSVETQWDFRRVEDKTKQALIRLTAALRPRSDLMASSSSIDIEGATQHLRDILKLDRPSNTTGELPGAAAASLALHSPLALAR